ncbi:MAG: acyl-CoA thioesterase [Planctomycetota bacterium]
MSAHAPATPLEPAPGLRPPAALGVPHPRPFALRLVAQPDTVSRAVAHVNNVEYVRWLDRAAELHADALGWTRARMADESRMWFVVRHEVDYRAEVFPGDELHVFTWVRTLGRSASWRDTEIVRARDGGRVCSASTCWAFVDLATRRPARVPPDMRAAFDPLEPAACTSRSSSIPTGS